MHVRRSSAVKAALKGLLDAPLPGAGAGEAEGERTMLESLYLKNVGPAPEMEMELAPRLNLITGDNGLSKSFLLDAAWWALTRQWPHDLIEQGGVVRVGERRGMRYQLREGGADA